MKKFALTAVIFAGLMAGPAVLAAQDGLVADPGIHGPVLTFDWPDIEIGVGAYEEGPTGLTIIRFMHRAAVVVNSRGGAPGTVNTNCSALGTTRRAWMPSCSRAARPMAKKLSPPS